MVIRAPAHRTLASLAAALLVAACGGAALGGGVRQEADARCAEASRALEEVAWPGEAELSLETAAPAIEATAAIHADLVTDLTALPASAEDRAVLRQVADAGRPIVEALERLQQAAAEGDDAGFDDALAEVIARGEEAADTSESLGLSTCYLTPAV